jgi:hypothetical protein
MTERFESSKHGTRFHALKTGHPDALRVLATLAWRLFQIGVATPATLAATVALAAILADGRPPQTLLADLHQSVDAAIRAAPPGHVLVRECVTPPFERVAPSSVPTPSLVCERVEATTISADEAIARSMAAFWTVYGVLVVISLGVAVITYPGRRFVGLHVGTRHARAATGWHGRVRGSGLSKRAAINRLGQSPE